MSEIWTPVGEVLNTWVYPVKGMQGIELDSGLTVSSVTAAGDRRYALCTGLPYSEDDETEYQKLPNEKADVEQIPSLIDTIRFPGLLEYRPYFVNPDNPKESKVRVITPGNDDFHVRSRLLRTELEARYNRQSKSAYDYPVEMIGLGRGLYHSMPISFLGIDTLAQIADWANKPVDPERFRENLIVKMFDGKPFSEDDLIGMLFRFGDREKSAELSAVKLDPRCATINFDPQTGTMDGGVLYPIKKNHNNTTGIYCGVHKQGNILPGDMIYAKAA